MPAAVTCAIRPDDLVLVLVDAQDEFLCAMHGTPEPLLARLERLLLPAEWLGFPVLVTLARPPAAPGRDQSSAGHPRRRRSSDAAASARHVASRGAAASAAA